MCLISVGIEDWLMTLNEARRKSIVIVEDIADDACSTRRENSTWGMVSTTAENTDRHTHSRFDESLEIGLNVDTSLEQAVQPAFVKLGERGQVLCCLLRVRQLCYKQEMLV